MDDPFSIDQKIVQLSKALQESEARFSAITEITSDAIIMADRDQRIIFFNRGAADLFGYHDSEVMGQPLDILIPNRFREKHRTHIHSFQAENVTSRLKEKRGTEIFGRRKDGSEFPAEASISKLYEGDSVLFTVILRDISDRKRAEIALVEEKERLLVTLRSIGDGVITTDDKGRVALMNQVAENLTGWSQDQACGKPLQEVFQILNEKTREPAENPVVKVLESGTIVGLANHTVLKSKEGMERSIADSGAPIRDRDGTTFGVVLVFRDVTEQQKVEEELLKAMKLESIGHLAAGIAHDFNNILTAILGNISLAKLEINPEVSSYQRLNETERAAIRAKELAFQLLTFSKGGAPRKRLMSIVDLLRDSTLFALRGSNVRPEFNLAQDLWPVDIDEGQINQVIHNLVINARQAMTGGGMIEVRAENQRIEEKEAKKAMLKPGPFVILSFKDSGHGIPKKYLSKIFDPFFTTKEKGSGLGLFSTYAIVKNHNGAITVASEEGLGTTFTVHLPAVTNVKIDHTKRENEILLGSGRILLLDDDESVRKIAEAMLQNLGYDVEYAPSGEEAILIYKKAKEAAQTLDAVIIDLTIPGGISGRETIQKLIEYDPGVKAIVSSGYSNDPIMANYKDYGFKDYLAKPYRLGILSRVLHKVLSN